MASRFRRRLPPPLPLLRAPLPRQNPTRSSAGENQMSLTPGTYAVFTTTEGTIKTRLFPEHAPKTVANFIALAEGTKDWTHPTGGKKSGEKLYDGTIFHRVIPQFMI